MWTAMDKKEKTTETEKPLYLGHRSRLRARFLIDNGASMPDYELLELLLTMSIPRRDVKPLAKRLIARFNNLNGVISAPIKELLDFSGISLSTAVLLKIVEEGNRRAASPKLGSRDEEKIRNWTDLADFARKQINKTDKPSIFALYFNSDIRYLGKRNVGETLNSELIDKYKLIAGLNEFSASIVALIFYIPENRFIDENKEFYKCQELKNYLRLFNTSLIDYQILLPDYNFSLWHLKMLK